MTGAQSADVVWLLLAMILVASALFSRRWSLRSALATALWWVAIFLIGVTIFTYRDEIGNVAHRVTQEVTGQNRQKIEGGTLRISRSEEHTSELQSLMRISYAVFCLKKKNHA